MPGSSRHSTFHKAMYPATSYHQQQPHDVLACFKFTTPSKLAIPPPLPNGFTQQLAREAQGTLYWQAPLNREQVHPQVQLVQNHNLNLLMSSRLSKPAGDVYLQIANTLQQLYCLKMRQSSMAHGTPNLIPPAIFTGTTNELIAAIMGTTLETPSTRHPRIGEHHVSHRATVPASQLEKQPRGFNMKSQEFSSERSPLVLTQQKLASFVPSGYGVASLDSRFTADYSSAHGQQIASDSGGFSHEIVSSASTERRTERSISHLDDDIGSELYVCESVGEGSITGASSCSGMKPARKRHNSDMGGGQDNVGGSIDSSKKRIGSANLSNKRGKRGTIMHLMLEVACCFQPSLHPSSTPLTNHFILQVVRKAPCARQ